MRNDEKSRSQGPALPMSRRPQNGRMMARREFAAAAMGLAAASCADQARRESSLSEQFMFADVQKDKIRLDAFKKVKEPSFLTFDFRILWISTGGLWVGGTNLFSLTNRQPPRVMLQQVKTSERRDFQGGLYWVQEFAMSDKLDRLVLLGLTREDMDDSDHSNLLLFDPRTENAAPIAILKGLSESPKLTGLVFTADGNRLSFALDGTLLIYHCVQQKLERQGEGWHAVMSPAGQHLAYLTDDDHVVIRDLSSGVETSPGKTSHCVRPRWSPDSQQLLFDLDGRGGLNTCGVVTYDIKSRAIEKVGEVGSVGGAEIVWLAR
jgi:hypothetical protein